MNPYYTSAKANIVENAKIDAEKPSSMRSWYDITQTKLADFLKNLRLNRKGWTDDKLMTIIDEWKEENLVNEQVEEVQENE